jgi:alkane 1-monooxygenase
MYILQFACFFLPLSIYISLNNSGWLAWTAMILSFGFLPLFELLVPTPAPKMVQPVVDFKVFIYDSFLWIMVGCHFYFIGTFLFLLHTNIGQFSDLSLVGWILAMGISHGVVSINVAHELGHRTNPVFQWGAKSLLLSSFYGHFMIEHNKGHHRHVATPLDPATAKRGQAVYTFWFQSVWGSFKSALHLDKKDTLIGFSLQVLFIFFIALYFGAEIAFYFWISQIMGILLLETVNYIQHYGLERKINTSGRYEKVQNAHSWNSDHLLSRLILFQLSRHSDHHTYINRPYYELNFLADSPALPTGYPGMVLLSLIPPLWFKKMNPLIDKQSEK